MQISLIAAIGQNFELGANNDLLWHLPIDFKWFIQHTKGKPVLMGRKTMESLGKPLKNRLNLVLSRSNPNLVEGFHLVSNITEAIDKVNEESYDELMIIGGAQIYEQTIDVCDRLIITHVAANFSQAETFFPKVNFQDWNCVFSEKHQADEQHAYPFEFCIYEKYV